MTNHSNIKALLEKYWLAETTLEEERQLVNYFSEGNVHEDLWQYAPLFQMLASEKNVPAWNDDDFQATLKANLQPKPTKTSIFHLWRYAATAAAVLMFAFFCYPYLTPTKSKEQGADFAMEDTYKTPEEALAATKAALFLLSDKMQKGTNHAGSNMKELDKLNNIINFK